MNMPKFAHILSPLAKDSLEKVAWNHWSIDR